VKRTILQLDIPPLNILMTSSDPDHSVPLTPSTAPMQVFIWTELAWKSPIDQAVDSKFRRLKQQLENV
jgi:hypothetical protein